MTLEEKEHLLNQIKEDYGDPICSEMKAWMNQQTDLTFRSVLNELDAKLRLNATGSREPQKHRTFRIGPAPFLTKGD